jgi:hypothetical protein
MIEGVETSILIFGGIMRESAYQAHVIRELEKRFPGCVVLKNDANYLQGIPDLLILFNNKWAMLEVKMSEDAPIQPNQEYYIEMFDVMSYGAFITPEREEEVLDDLQHTLQPRRDSRLSQRQ